MHPDSLGVKRIFLYDTLLPLIWVNVNMEVCFSRGKAANHLTYVSLETRSDLLLAYERAGAL